MNTYIRNAIGLSLGFSIGFTCALTVMPLPAPPVLLGACLVMTITLGYKGTDYILKRKKPYAQGENHGH